MLKAISLYVLSLSVALADPIVLQAEDYDAVKVVRGHINELKVGKNDWPQWAGSYLRK